MRVAIGGIVVAIALLQSQSSWAFTHNRTTQGGVIRWNTQKTINLVGNPNGRASITSEQYFEAIVHGLQKWQGASGKDAPGSSPLQFDYWQGTDPGTYPAQVEYDGVSSVFLVSNSKQSFELADPNVIGLTQVWYDTDSGEILEADIYLNDVHFEFTNNPQDTARDFVDGGRPRVFIKNVMTHEIGHSLGLSHSGHGHSTMYPVEYLEQANLSCDDQTGVRTQLQSNPFDSGAVRGSIRSTDGSLQRGSQAIVVSQDRMRIEAMAVSDDQAEFVASGLRPGNYLMLAEPLKIPEESIPDYYNFNADPFCQPSDVGLSGVYEFEITASQDTRLGGLNFDCDLETQRDWEIDFANRDRFNRIFHLADGIHSQPKIEVSLREVDPNLSIRVLGHSLGVPIGASFVLKDQTGSVVAQQALTLSEHLQSGYENYDSTFQVSGLSPGDYQLDIQLESLSFGLFPFDIHDVNRIPGVLVMGESVAQGSERVDLSGASCKIAEAYAPYTSPEGGPPVPFADDRDQSSFLGSCAPPGGGSGIAASIAGGGPGGPISFFLPFLMIGLTLMTRKFALSMRNRYSI